MKKTILFFAIAFIAGKAYGQGEIDAFKLSQNDLQGSARGIAMGGAFGALGGDITGIAQNPAGIGVYRSSEAVATLDFSSVNIETNTLGTITSDNKFNFSLENFAYNLVGYTPSTGELKSLNFGFSYNRLKNFGKNYQERRNGLSSSLTDYIANYSTRERDLYPNERDGWSYDQGYPWISVLGYNGWLIDHAGSTGNTHKYESFLDPGEKVDRTYSVSEKGHIDAYDFTAGANISDMLYLGLTFSTTDINYKLNSRHKERLEQGGMFDLDNYLNTKGSGYQVSAGAIFRPVDEIRLGIAYHSPTWYHLTDFYYAEVSWNNRRETYTPNDAFSDYKLRTPDRWVASFAGVLGRKAIVSFDYEYTDYSKMKLNDIDGLYNDYYGEQNSYISEDFKGSSTIKAGLEYKVTPQIALRVGYSWVESPLEKQFKNGESEVLPVGTVTAYTLDGDVKSFSYGAGYRFTPDFYMDFAFVFRKQTNQLYTYSPIFTDGLEVTSISSELKNNTYRGLLTLGYKF